MSSWQQALSDDIRKGKKRVDCPVVMNRNQEKNLKTGRDDCDKDSWTCSCGSTQLGTYYRCEKCGALRPDERETRLQMRARDCEIGRGGGFFQRASVDDRKGWDSDEEEIDEFGRKKRKASASHASAAAATAASAPPAPAEAAGGRSAGKQPESRMSERQKAALARLHQKGSRLSGGGRESRSRSQSPRRRR